MMALEEKRSTVTGIDLALIEQVDTAVPCQIDICATDMKPCLNPPAILVVFKSICDHHGNLPDGDPLVCTEHATWLATGNYGCGGCGCNVAEVGGWQHFIIRFQEA